MKLHCEIVKDLLPLYSDNVCSEESKAAVEEHLAECEPCSEVLKAISDYKTVSLLRQESGSLIIGKYRKSLLNKLLLLAVCTVIFPLITAFYYRYVSYHTLYFFIVTLIALVSFVYIPAVVCKKRSVWIAASSVINPVLIITVTFILDGINIFNAIPISVYCLFSLIMFMINRKKEPLEPSQYRKTAFKILMIETAIFYYCGFLSTLMSMTEYEDGIFLYILRGAELTTYFLAFLWLAFLVFRFVKSNIFIKLGMYTVMLGFFLSTLDTVRAYIYYHTIYTAFWKVDFFYSTSYDTASNVCFVILIISLLTAAVLFGIGLVQSGKFKKKNIDKQ